MTARIDTRINLFILSPWHTVSTGVPTSKCLAQYLILQGMQRGRINGTEIRRSYWRTLFADCATDYLLITGMSTAKFSCYEIRTVSHSMDIDQSQRRNLRRGNAFELLLKRRMGHHSHTDNRLVCHCTELHGRGLCSVQGTT